MTQTSILSTAAADHRYVAFLDVLGFSSLTKGDFRAALAIYDDLIESINVCRTVTSSDLTIRVFSDSILLVSSNLREILHATNVLHQGTLLCDCLIRGGIAAGPHCEVSRDGNLYIVSEALVHAVRLEHEVKNPCVALHSSILPQLKKGRASTQPNSPFFRLILFYEGHWIVNPFNITWGHSAAVRVHQLKEAFPEFNEKYDWFLGLYEAISKGDSLSPTQGHEIK